ncbi:type II secretion system protein [Endozoicomonas arenosclerae]|uniref:type II secretion system protein n=1 Tax=Endozoicomonas arenosclerae TaxID=1633495 RepID=UPI001FE06F06|nr:type II secretion system protein [Endozoicomonas arenosclerae]
MISDLNLLLNAAEEYRKDTGEVLQVTSDTDPAYGYLKIDHLISNPGKAGWNGPYLPYKDYWLGGEQYVDHPVYNAAQLLSKEEGTEWVRGSTPEGCRKSSPSCSIAACIWLVPGDLAQQVNFEIDGVFNKASADPVGRIRYENGLFGGIVCMIGGQYPKEKSPVD